MKSRISFFKTFSPKMDQIVSTLKSGLVDSISITELSKAFSQIDINDISAIQLIMSTSAYLIHTLTVLMIKNCCDKESVFELVLLIKSICRVYELEYVLFNNADFVLALDRLMHIHECVEETVSLVAHVPQVDQSLRTKIVNTFTSKPNEQVALGLARISEHLNLEEKSAILQQAVNTVDTVDSGMLFAQISLILKCKGMTDSQVPKVLIIL